MYIFTWRWWSASARSRTRHDWRTCTVELLGIIGVQQSTMHRSIGYKKVFADFNWDNGPTRLRSSRRGSRFRCRLCRPVARRRPIPSRRLGDAAAGKCCKSESVTGVGLKLGPAAADHLVPRGVPSSQCPLMPLPLSLYCVLHRSLVRPVSIVDYCDAL